MEVGPCLVNEFSQNGRGPILEKIHWAYNGKTLRAIDFQNSDDEIQHLFFTGVQVVMFTPEEVINYKTISSLWSVNRKAGIICLGKSEWLQSFLAQHLSKCNHYQIMFYDELLDLICETVEIRDGSYRTE